MAISHAPSIVPPSAENRPMKRWAKSGSSRHSRHSPSRRLMPYRRATPRVSK
jgi:hypothetical protein